MPEFNPGDRVVAAVKGRGHVAAEVVHWTEPDDGVEVSPGVWRDAVRVRYSEGELDGTSGKHLPSELRPA